LTDIEIGGSMVNKYAYIGQFSTKEKERKHVHVTRWSLLIDAIYMFSQFGHSWAS
jgi:hypothetical protein